MGGFSAQQALFGKASVYSSFSPGRVLVLEGIEKVERNVLPVLNNLLENREMHLEDGRLLIPAARLEIVFLTVPFQALVRINSPTPLLFPINLKNKRMRGGLGIH